MTDHTPTGPPDPIAVPGAEGLVRFGVEPEVFHRLPRHPDWRYELWDGAVAHLSHHPAPLRLMRTTAVGSPACEAGRYNVRALTEQADLEAVAEFLATVWRDEDPYRSFEHPDVQFRADLARDIAGAELILAAYEGSTIVGAVLIAKDRRSAAPILTWLGVPRAGGSDRPTGIGLGGSCRARCPEADERCVGREPGKSALASKPRVHARAEISPVSTE